MDREIRELLDTTSSGNAILFTGAGFSHGTRDRRGRLLPSSAEMTAELWRHLFGDEPQDGSSLSDLFDVALQRDRDALIEYLNERLTVDDDVPGHVAAWLSAPWRRIYTLNVDDLEAAVGRCCKLPHRLVSVSAPGVTALRPDALAARTIEVVHLNGMLGQPVEHVTFSTLQYAERLCDRQPAYEQLAADLEHSPFVFVGTTLDEAVLWQHVMERRLPRDKAARRPRSFLVARALTRARGILLENLGITWLALSAEDAARELFDPGVLS